VVDLVGKPQGLGRFCSKCCCVKDLNEGFYTCVRGFIEPSTTLIERNVISYINEHALLINDRVYI